MKKRLRRLTILNRCVGAIDSKTVYMEANLFYLLTNAAHCARMVQELGNFGRSGFDRVDFGFDNRDNVHLIEYENELSKGSVKVAIMSEVKKGSKGSSPTKSRRSIFKRRQHMWQQIGDKVKLKLELIPDWMDWKPSMMDNAQTKLNGNIGALLLSGVELNIVPQGPLRDPDLVKLSATSSLPPSLKHLMGDLHRRQVMLMGMKFRSVDEAKKRIGLLTMKTFQESNETYCPALSFSGLAAVDKHLKLDVEAVRKMERWGKPLALPSVWMPELRELTPSARLQLEIMCQLHTNDIQPVSFLSKLGGVENTSNNDDDSSEGKHVPERPKSARLRSPKNILSRPQTAGGAMRKKDQTVECWVSGVRSPKYMHQRPKTRGGGERVQSPPARIEGESVRVAKRRAQMARFCCIDGSVNASTCSVSAVKLKTYFNAINVISPATLFFARCRSREGRRWSDFRARC